MKVAFLGCGNMGSAILRAVIANGVVKPEEVIVLTATPASRETLKKDLGVVATGSPVEAVTFADVIIVAVKPHIVKGVMSALHGGGDIESKLFISVAAGVPLETLSQMASGRWARVMPNVACRVGQSATAYFPSPSCTEADTQHIEALFNACGVTMRVAAEPQLDAATGVAGSGIAYIFLVLEALADGGVRAGLPRAVAQTLATQTVLGGAAMQKELQMHPGVLKDTVCSPGGTTIEAVATLERNGVRSAFIEAVNSAFTKAQDLGNKEKSKK
eukprot:TRINITY_DN66163_c0_g1_i1.p1 TRINITY_DN66163_c0_g1~~TRINITY_DN66163_c0_g1_i1.p1  ORF type:complete len:291 (+),score=116.78 TRINITY_DN66163_c0_g1_i1:55-873(+)